LRYSFGVIFIVGCKTFEKDIHVSCYQQMFPYAELAARQTCAMGGMPNFVLLRQKMNRNNVMLGRKNPETKS